MTRALTVGLFMFNVASVSAWTTLLACGVVGNVALPPIILGTMGAISGAFAFIEDEQ